MIKDIIDLLGSSEHYNISQRVEIAKGKHSIAYTFRDGLKKIKRLWLIRKLK
jgi:hypothetical protein